jgi:cyclopropane fatty-acyl-phospholipid synthase-like methyltransferase
VRVLDVGCGAGTLLEMVRQRGGSGIGITISPEQQRWCRSRGLDVRLINYVELGREFDGKFDAVVANGSIEHFVQPADALAGQAEVMYTRLFRILHRVLDPTSPVRRVATTVIHFVRRPSPRALVSSPRQYVRGSDNYHYSLLAGSFGGCYPTLGQLERCANGFFSPARAVDGTEDYRLTSEQWLERVRATLRSPRGLKILAEALPLVVRHPVQFSRMVECMLWAESWNWQFRGPTAPTRLLRHTWQYCPLSSRVTKRELAPTVTYRPFSDATKQESCARA